jgi:hypothetical protein
VTKITVLKVLLVGAVATVFVSLPWSAAGAAFSNAGRDKVSYIDSSGGISSTSTVGGASAQDFAGPGLGNPAWSSDGGKLAYDAGGGIFVNGSALTAGTNPAWSQGGHTLAYERGGNIWCIGYPLPADSPTCGAGTNLGNSGVDPTFTPTGVTQKIAFAQLQLGHYQIVVADPTVGASPVTFAQPGNNRSPSYSPDGSQIAFQSDQSGSWQIWVMSATDGSGAHQITSDSGNDQHPAWSPDGTRIAFDSGNTIETVLLADAPTSTYTALASGNAPDWRDAAPINLVLPSVTPIPTTTGQLLTATPGTWNGSPAFSYQWQRSTDSGNTWSDIAGETGTSYTVQSGDLATGVELRIVVTATNALGSTTANGSPAGAVPANVSPPTVSGTASADGGFLFASPGTWTGVSPITYTYQWLRCFGHTDGHCMPIPGATSSFYSPTGDDIDTQLNVAVIATNSAGKGGASSAATPYVTGTPPRNHVSPTISGGIEVGSVLSTTDGTWFGSQPITFTYQWRICKPDGSDCNSIPGATGNTYTLQPSDYGSTIRIMIRGRNGAGVAFGVSNHTLPILHKTLFGPAVSQAPTITGPARAGEVLTATDGTWTGEAPITFAYAWQRCDATGSGCKPIGGAKKQTYKPGKNDVGSTIRVAVTATNVVNKATVSSDATDTIAAQQLHRKGKRIVGKRGQLVLTGTVRDDVIFAGPGNVTIYGMGGFDQIHAGAGNDVVYLGTGGSSRVWGGAGSNTIYAQNGERDTITCGKGPSHVFADAFDVVKGCTVVTTPTPPSPPLKS